MLRGKTSFVADRVGIGVQVTGWSETKAGCMLLTTEQRRYSVGARRTRSGLNQLTCAVEELSYPVRCCSVEPTRLWLMDLLYRPATPLSLDATKHFPYQIGRYILQIAQRDNVAGYIFLPSAVGSAVGTVSENPICILFSVNVFSTSRVHLSYQTRAVEEPCYPVRCCSIEPTCLWLIELLNRGATRSSLDPSNNL